MRGGRGDPDQHRRSGRRAAGAARPRPAGVPLRDRRPDQRGRRPRRRRPRRGQRRWRTCTARAASSDWCRSAARPARRCRPTWCGPVPGLLVGGPARGVPELPRRSALAAERVDDPADRCRPGRASPPRSRRTRCATRSPPTCSTAARTSGSSRSCSATPRSRPRRCTRRSPSSTCARCTPWPTPGPAAERARLAAAARRGSAPEGRPLPGVTGGAGRIASSADARTGDGRGVH